MPRRDEHNLLVVCHHPVFGGPHNQAVQLAGPLAAAGFRTTVVLPNEAGNAAERLRAAGVPVVTLPLGRLRAHRDLRVHVRMALEARREVRNLRDLIRERRIDLVELTGLVNPHAAVAARLEGKPVVWQILDTRAPMALRLMLIPFLLLLSDVIMTTGTEVAGAHPGVRSMRDRVVTYFPPVDTDRFQPALAASRRTARAELAIPDDRPAIGTLGNLNPQKGHEYLLRAAAVVRQRVPEVALRILGADTPTHVDYADELRSEARALDFGNGGEPLLVDPGARAADLLPAFDVFLLTSVPRSEGVPTALLEAMACGLPVVAADVGGVREAVVDGQTGFVVPPLDAGRLAEATTRLLEDPLLRRWMAGAARRRAVDRFDTRESCVTHMRAFHQALARRPRSHRFVG